MDERNYLVGTAGHVDHGKTELIRALSGMETDRLREEKQRGISIELGFAHMILPSGRQVGIVDVPGHEKFVRQMLAGASGMDAVLLVIAADEGIMPQTREHMDILSLLGTSRGIVVINKADLVDDEWLDLIEEEIREELRETVFSEAPICRVSALTGFGIPALKQTIDELLADVESKKSTGPVRLPIDRVFSIQGFGTVATGTLYSGTVKLGQELVIEPGRILTKVRSLQVHNSKVNSAGAGQRVAVNLAGVDVAEVKRGSVLIMPDAFGISNILDLKVKNLASAEKPLTQRQRVRFHLGTNEVLGRLHLLDQEELAHGQEGFAQIILEEQVVAAPGDRFVLRFYSPAHTIAGGKVLSVSAYKLKRFRESSLAPLRMKDLGDPLDLLEKEIAEPSLISEIAARLHISTNELEADLRALEGLERLEAWAEDEYKLYWGKTSAKVWLAKLIKLVQEYEISNPLRGGISREELKTRLGVSWPHRRWQTILEQGAERGYYRITGSKVQTNDGPEIPEHIQIRLNALSTKWQNVGFTPPDLLAAAESCGISKTEITEYAQYLCEIGEWVHVDQYYYRQKDLESAQQSLTEFLKSHGEAGVSEVRELWGVSRKYVVPLLEYFDRQKITKRIGDKRVLF